MFVNAALTDNPVGVGGGVVSAVPVLVLIVVIVVLDMFVLNPLLTTDPLGKGFPEIALPKISSVSFIGRRMAAMVVSLTGVIEGIPGSLGRSAILKPLQVQPQKWQLLHVE